MLNYMTLQGRLVADPELRHTQTQLPVCSFRVAWSEKYKESETKLFLPCTAWRSSAEFVSKYFRKGQEIIVEGKLSTRDWKDKDGNNRQTIEMTVDRVHFCGPKQEGGYSTSTNNPSRNSAQDPLPDDYANNTAWSDLESSEDDLPF